MDDAAKETFAAKVDANASTLDREEQAALVDLLFGDDEVTGFGAAWPGMWSFLGGCNIGGNAIEGNPDGVIVSGRTNTLRTDTGFAETASGSPNF